MIGASSARSQTEIQILIERLSKNCRWYFVAVKTSAKAGLNYLTGE